MVNRILFRTHAVGNERKWSRKRADVGNYATKCKKDKKIFTRSMSRCIDAFRKPCVGFSVGPIAQSVRAADS